MTITLKEALHGLDGGSSYMTISMSEGLDLVLDNSDRSIPCFYFILSDPSDDGSNGGRRKRRRGRRKDEENDEDCYIPLLHPCISKPLTSLDEELEVYRKGKTEELVSMIKSKTLDEFCDDEGKDDAKAMLDDVDFTRCLRESIDNDVSYAIRGSKNSRVQSLRELCIGLIGKPIKEFERMLASSAEDDTILISRYHDYGYHNEHLTHFIDILPSDKTRYRIFNLLTFGSYYRLMRDELEAISAKYMAWFAIHESAQRYRAYLSEEASYLALDGYGSTTKKLGKLMQFYDHIMVVAENNRRRMERLYHDVKEQFGIFGYTPKDDDLVRIRKAVSDAITRTVDRDDPTVELDKELM